jgi:peptidyl-tRNA hydrolase ICT1
MFNLNKCIPKFSFSNLRKYLVSNQICKFSWKNIEIPMEKIEMAFSRSSGAGGQNVNKLNTKVEIRFKLDSAEWLSEDVKKRISELYANKINKEGEFILTSQEHRTQEMNRSEIQKKLKMIIHEASQPKHERIMHPIVESDKQEEKRIQEKRNRSKIKKMRRNEDF